MTEPGAGRRLLTRGLGSSGFGVQNRALGRKIPPAKGPAFPFFWQCPGIYWDPRGGCVLDKRFFWLLYMGALGLSVMFYRSNAAVGGILLAAGLARLLTAGKR